MMIRYAVVLLLPVILLICPRVSYADTILVGYDTAFYSDMSCRITSTCWSQASTLENGSWKASRYQALASGTISYFKLRVASTPTGCTNDSGCWAIYDGGTSSAVGALKAYTCFTGYDWTTIGIGDHSWNVETTVTNLSVTAGSYYWIVFYSKAVDATHYGDAGCAAYIPSYRGQNTQCCFDEANLDQSVAASHGCSEYYSYPPPPANTSLTVPLATYVMWGVWASEVCDEDNLNLCTNLADCEGAGGYWYSDTCNAAAPDDPEITDTDVSFIHGNNVVIGGYSFGTKSPAAPLWWDDGEGATNAQDIPSGEISWATSTLTGADKTYKTSSPSNLVTSAEKNLKYRNVDWRSTSAPHSNSTKYMTGCHSEEFECPNAGQNAETGQNVGVTMTDGSLHLIWYSHYYLRLDPAWPSVAEIGQQNYKYQQWEYTPPYAMYNPTANYDNTTSCSGAEGNPTGIGRKSPPCGEDYWNAEILMELASSGCNAGSPNYFYPVITYSTSVANPYNVWTRNELEYNATEGNNLYRHKVNNVEMVDTSNLPGCGVGQSGTGIGGLTIGGFFKVGASCVEDGKHHLENDACRYFDDIYIDTTFSRVMLCNNATYTSATICEPQIPVEWSTSSITVKANLGALTGETAYLFVFDSANDANATGYEVTLGESTTPSTISGVMVKSGPFK